tara:strand:+ start:196 stop:465 length:270 start_codon:yes stop_codon:yes gene_type:complete
MNCPNKNFLKKYGTKCNKVNDKIICENLDKLKNNCQNCFYYHLVKCHGKYYALPCMYPCGKNTGLYHMCPNVHKNTPTKCYKTIGYYRF